MAAWAHGLAVMTTPLHGVDHRFKSGWAHPHCSRDVVGTAGQGPGKPPGMEKELAGLFDQVHDVCRKQVEPVLAGPPLLTGSDLIAVGLVPGPFFKDILGEAERAQVEGTIHNRSQALDWLRDFLSSR